MRCIIIYLSLVTFIFFGPILRADNIAGNVEPKLREAFYAYTNSNFKLAKKLSKDYLDSPQGKLVYNLCQIYDKKSTGLKDGLRGLYELYNDKRLDSMLRAEAGLCYGRHVQIFQIRGMHSWLKDVDVESIFKNIVSFAPKSTHAVYSALYLCQGYFNESDKLFTFLEKFTSDFKGVSSDKVMLHLAADMFYIEIKEDYAKSIYHLESALELGITKTLLRRSVIFRLGRMYELKLKNPQRAVLYYKQYLRQYPNTKRSPLVRRYLDQLSSEAN